MKTGIRSPEIQADFGLEIMEVLEAIRAKKRQQEQKLGDNQARGATESVSQWPLQMAQKVLDFERKLRSKEEAFTEEEIQEWVKEKMEEVKLSYLEKRYATPNKEYLRQEMFRVVDKIFDDGPDDDKTKNIALINFDLNGLKSVNDLAGHENGDEYLRRVVEIFKNGVTTSKLKDKGISPFFATCGGDEFAVLLNGSLDLTSAQALPEFSKPEGVTLADWITEQYQQEIQEIDCADLIDFSNQAIREKFKGIKIPDGFEFRASVSGGCISLTEILLNMSEEEKERVLSLDYDKSINNFVGSLLDGSDKKARENKSEFKHELERSEDENSRFLAIIYKRTDEAVRLSEENRDLREKLAEKERARYAIFD